MSEKLPSRFASVFYAGFVLLALVGGALAVIEDPDGKDRVSLYAKNSVVGDTPIQVNADGEIGINDGGNSITVDGTVTVGNSSGGSAVNIQDGGNSITVDGTVTVTDGAGALNVIVDSGTVAATQSGTWVLGANSGVDIGDVTINNAAGASAVNVQDGGNSLTVDGTVTVTDGSGNLTVDGTVNATIAAGTSGPQKAEDAGFADTDVGIPAACIRDDTPGNTSGTNLDYEFLQCNGGRLWVDASGVNVTVTQATAANLNATVTDGTGPLTVDGTVTVTDGSGALNVIVDSGTTTLTNGTTGPQKAEDAASANTDVGIPSMCVRDDTPGNSTDTNLDYEFVQCSAGRVWVDGSGVNLTVGTFPDNEPFNVAQINGVTPLMGAGNTGTGSPRVTIATDQAAIATHGHGATAAAVPSGAQQMGYRSDGGLSAGTAALTSPIICQDNFAIDITSDNSQTELVALTSSETIYVCNIMIIAAAAVSVQFVYGTGSACATGETVLTGDISLAANGGFVMPGPYPTFKAAVSNALCLELTGTGNVGGWITYTKF